MDPCREHPPPHYRQAFAIHSGGGGDGQGDATINFWLNGDGSTNGVLTTSDGTSGNDINRPQGGTPVEGQWHHIVFVRESNTQRIYMDGVGFPQVSDSLPEYSITNGFLEVGAPNFWNGSWTQNNRDTAKWTGKLDDFRFHDRALSEEEILTLYGQTSISGIFFDDFSYACGAGCSPGLLEETNWHGLNGEFQYQMWSSHPQPPLGGFAAIAEGMELILQPKAMPGPGSTDAPIIFTRWNRNEGTYAARVYYDDGPIDTSDYIVEAFWTQTHHSGQASETYAECDFEYQPAGDGNRIGPLIDLVTWEQCIPPCDPPGAGDREFTCYGADASCTPLDNGNELGDRWIDLFLSVTPGDHVRYRVFESVAGAERLDTGEGARLWRAAGSEVARGCRPR